MKYFKNTELAKLYNISEKSVRNWIDAAEADKLGLELYEEKGKHYIANTSKNTSLVEQLVQKGKKYKNTRGYKKIKPSEKFYTTYNAREIFDIISNLDIHREIPHQYNYFKEGAVYWDLYTHRLAEENTPNSLAYNLQLLDFNSDFMTELLADFERINVIDIGPGNSMPVKKLLETLLDRGVLNRYIALDISDDMLKIAEQNVMDWFGKDFPYEGYIRDVKYDRFTDLLMQDSFGEQSTSNLVLFLGDTISNFRDSDHALTTIHDSMGKNDLLIFSGKLDTEKSRRYFDFTIDSNNPQLSFRGKAMVDMLNIDRSFYEVEQSFDDKKMERQRRIRLNVALTIEFEIGGKPRSVELNKGESILIWRARHRNTIEIIKEFDHNNFDLQQTTETKDQQYLQIIARIKTDINK
ncbi:MAG TPA: L-histidine N(alpha)-methyltransferase [Candidatus Saccharimonadales bacterium]|nr:L-histidine N(alpha)-methyltransferase [Candidatus Saccharimonadales bacterium]